MGGGAHESSAFSRLCSRLLNEDGDVSGDIGYEQIRMAVPLMKLKWGEK